MKKYIVGITGASGSIYGKCLTEELLLAGSSVYLIVSRRGKQVFEYELDSSLEKWVLGLKDKYGELIFPKEDDDMFAGIASGSFGCHGMAVAPCSVSTAGELAAGITPTLLTRAADVMLKERRKLVLVIRETPLSSIHLENLLKLSRAGAVILPAMPGFYQKPKTLEDVEKFMTGKILDSLEIENHLYEHWKDQEG